MAHELIVVSIGPSGATRTGDVMEEGPADRGSVSDADWLVRPQPWSINARAVFDVLLAHGHLTRGGIAELTGLGRVTASGVVDQLLLRGFLTHIGTAARSSGGPNARTYGLVRSAAYAVGVAAYLDRIVVTAATITGDIVAELTATAGAGDDNAGRIHALILECLSDIGAPLERLHRVVVGTQGVVDPSEQEHLLYVTNVRSWQRELTHRLRDALGCPVVFENDVNLAAVAEFYLGAGRAVSDLVFVWLDEGVATGMIVDGRLLRGDNGWGGEIGFIPALVTGAADNHVGVSGPLLTHVQDAASVPGLGALGEQFGVPYRGIVAAMSAGFPGIRDKEMLYDEIARRVVLAIGPATLMLDPDIIVLAGSIASAGGQALLDHMAPHLVGLGGIPTNVQFTQVVDDPIVRGAVLLAVGDARDALFVPTQGRWGL